MSELPHRSDQTRILTVSAQPALARVISRIMTSIWSDAFIAVTHSMDGLVNFRGAGKSNCHFDLVMLDLAICANDMAGAVTVIRRMSSAADAAVIAIGCVQRDQVTQRRLQWAGADLIVSPGELRRRASDIASLAFDRWFTVDCPDCPVFCGLDCPRLHPQQWAFPTATVA